ncbi:peptidase, partial [Staphylococcus epidermidis]
PKCGIIEVFIDDKSKGTFDCESAQYSTQKVILATVLSKCKHSFRGIFKSKKSGIDYKKSNPVMYVGTSKSSVLNLTA